jgi:hypothetical protein
LKLHTSGDFVLALTHKNLLGRLVCVIAHGTGLLGSLQANLQRSLQDSAREEGISTDYLTISQPSSSLHERGACSLCAQDLNDPSSTKSRERFLEDVAPFEYESRQESETREKNDRWKLKRKYQLLEFSCCDAFFNSYL